jgi:nitrite reductase/ring-hydroxylating ferredoxin subunit
VARITLGKTSEINEGNGKAFDVGQRCIAIFNVGGKFYALDDTCPHRGASLAKGYLGETDICCPLHNATFALTDGSGLSGLCGPGVNAYPVTVSGDDIEIEVPD